MKNADLKFIASMLVFAAITACSVTENDSHCEYSSQAPVKSVTGPNTTVVNVPITLSVTFLAANGCGEFDEFQVGSGFPKEIKPFIDYEGCQCAAPKEDMTEEYVFQAPAPGEYELRFPTLESPITKIITVTAE